MPRPRGTKATTRPRGVDDIPDELELPRPRLPREGQQEQLTRDLEIDPAF